MNDYEPPIRIIDQMSSLISKSYDDAVLKAVHGIGIDIDEQALVQALNNDRRRYSEAYERGRMSMSPNFITDRMKIFALSLCITDCECEGCPYLSLSTNGECKKRLRMDIENLLERYVVKRSEMNDHK